MSQRSSDRRTRQELIIALHNLELQVQEVKRLVEKVVPQADWLTTNEFAELAGIKAKTASNYAGKGVFSLVKKAENGKWLIHVSELEKF